MSDQPESGFQLRRLDDDVALFTLARPAKLNSLTKAMLDGLGDALDALPDQGVRVLIVTGEGDKSFCAGTDLAEIRGMERDARLAKNKMARELFFRLSRSPLMSIAALNGLAYGGGLELAMACTFRLARPHVRVSLPEIKLGLLPAYAGTQFLPAIVGRDRALEMMITGRAVDSAEALAMGLLTRVVPADGELIEHALAFAREFTIYSQPAIDAIRGCVDAAGATVTEQGLSVEDAAVTRVFQTDDAREGVAAFLEKRAPVFRHR
ncbi:MAG: enoyl-CoA hydratase-related protein [Burkholderiaceae bacterium]